MSNQLEAQIARLERVAERLEKLIPGAGAGIAAAAASSSVLPPPPPSASAAGAAAAPSAASKALQEIIDNQYKEFLDAAEGYDYPQRLLPKVTAGLKSVAQLINAAPRSQKPSGADIFEALKDLSVAINEADSCAFDAEITREGDHVKLIHESLPMFSFPLFTCTGKDFTEMVQSYADASVVYINKVLVKARNGDNEELNAKDKKYAESYKQFIQAASDYVCKTFAKNGLPYKGEGGLSLSEAMKSDGSAAKPAAGVPPPPPPSSGASAAATAPAAPLDARSGLLKEIQQGVDITSRLRHVSKEEKQAAKQAALSSGPIIETERKTVEPAPTKQAPAVKKAAITRQNAFSKVFVDNYVDNVTDLTFDDLPFNFSIFIGNCKTSTVHIPKKVKAVSIDGCRRVKVFVESVLTTVDIVNSQNVHLIINGVVPTVAIDKSAGCIVALTEAAVKQSVPQLVTSNISDCNVQIPNPFKIDKNNDEMDDVVEIPIPEQFKIDISPDVAKLHTEAIIHG